MAPSTSVMRLIAGALLLAACCAAAAPSAHRALLQSDDYEAKLREQAKAAATFCQAAQASKAPCGWADDKEQQATASQVCQLCGTVWSGEITDLPHTFQAGGRAYWQYVPRFVSLACRPQGGRLLLRAVYKIANFSDPAIGGCIRMEPSADPGTAARDFSALRRCDLALPPHEPGGEVAAALRSQEVGCKDCTNCETCPKQAGGRWYSDTATFTCECCSSVSKPNATYNPTKPAMISNPGVEWVLAKFELQEAP